MEYKKMKERSTHARYTSKIIKAGALLADTKTLLAYWDAGTSIRENLERMRRGNLLGKGSRSRIEDVLAIFRQRYLTDAAVAKALVVLVKHRLPAASLDRILYFHAAQADLLLHDVVAELLFPLRLQGTTDIDAVEIEHVLTRWAREGKTTAPWGEYTIQRVVRGLLATLRDFAVLTGTVKRRIAPAYLPVEAFAYVMFYLKQRQPSGAKLLDSPDWKLFFLPHEGVERLLIEAHQQGLLEYHAAGSVIRLTFPAHTLMEYAHVLAESAH